MIKVAKINKIPGLMCGSDIHFCYEWQSAEICGAKVGCQQGGMATCPKSIKCNNIKYQNIELTKNIEYSND
jgi:hypothetical protein